MAIHYSGNSTWVDYPSTSTLITATALENVERALDRTQVCVFQGRATAAQSMTSGIYTPVNLPAEDFDTDNAHSTSTNTSRFTCVRAGSYELDGAVVWPSNAAGVRAAQFNLNGTMILGSYNQITAATGPPMVVRPVSVFVNLASGDYVELVTVQTTGAAASTQSDSVLTSMMKVTSVALT